MCRGAGIEGPTCSAVNVRWLSGHAEGIDPEVDTVIVLLCSKPAALGWGDIEVRHCVGSSDGLDELLYSTCGKRVLIWISPSV
jgi:hypothetical protein